MNKQHALRKKIASLESIYKSIRSLKNAQLLKFNDWQQKLTWARLRLAEAKHLFLKLDPSQKLNMIFLNKGLKLEQFAGKYPGFKIEVWSTQDEVYKIYQGQPLNNIVWLGCNAQNINQISIIETLMSRDLYQPLLQILLEYVEAKRQADYFYLEYLRFYRALKPCEDIIRERENQYLKARKERNTLDLLEIIE